jgi:predicted NodU family carbamoyl transferase
LNIIGFSHLEPYARYFHDTNISVDLATGEAFASLEERNSRIKHHAGLPVGAVLAVQRRFGLKLNDFDVIAVGENRQSGVAQLGNRTATAWLPSALPSRSGKARNFSSTTTSWPTLRPRIGSAHFPRHSS